MYYKKLYKWTRKKKYRCAFSDIIAFWKKCSSFPRKYCKRNFFQIHCTFYLKRASGT